LWCRTSVLGSAAERPAVSLAIRLRFAEGHCVAGDRVLQFRVKR
jgi:hypothetical protein